MLIYFCFLESQTSVRQQGFSPLLQKVEDLALCLQPAGVSSSRRLGEKMFLRVSCEQKRQQWVELTRSLPDGLEVPAGLFIDIKT